MSELSRIIQLLEDIKINTGGPKKGRNPTQIVTRTLTLSSTTEPVQLEKLDIPYDFKVQFLTPSGNSGTVYIGNSAVEAENTTMSYPLVAGKTVEYKIDNLGQLWVLPTAANDKITWTVEQWSENWR